MSGDVGLMAGRQGEFTATTYRPNFLYGGDGRSHLVARDVSCGVSLTVHSCDRSDVVVVAFSRWSCEPRTCSQKGTSHGL